ncbi:LysR substrate-binding domain-containing protein [Kiloniella sp.]|uniref:LysR substrate-binding domain-containing protein n=1 Tax=Kiloniella sp. TaxID=1938587 RepID=UPI003A8F04FE
MKRVIDLPFLTALPAFEASARFCSFTKAANHLNLTQSAVSFQVRKLEGELGLPLFVRGQRTLVLTQEGSRLLKAVESAFEVLHIERAAITKAATRSQFVMSVPISFCSRWLVPRISRLQERLQNVDLRIDINDRLVDLAREGVDLAIRYCPDSPQELQSESLLLDQIFPVCTPEFQKNLPAEVNPEQLAAVMLLHDDMADFGWPKWFEAIGVSLPQLTHGPSFSHTGAAIEAAIAGQGLALGRAVLVADDLINGRLVRPFEQVAVSNYGYCALWPNNPSQAELTEIALIWLREELNQTLGAVFGDNHVQVD